MLKLLLIKTGEAFIFLCLLYGSTAYCGQNQWLHGDRLSVVVTQNTIPWAYKEGSSPMGIDIEVLQVIAKRMGFEFELGFYPFKRVFSYMQKGERDAVLLLYQTKEREKTVWYNQTPMHTSTLYVFVETGREFAFNSIEDLYGKVIIKNRGFAISPEFDQAVLEGNIYIQESEFRERLIKITLSRRVDAFVSNYASAKLAIKKLGVQNQVVHLKRPLIEKGVYFALSRQASNIKDKAAFLETFNETLLEIKSEGIYRRIMRKYLD